MDDKAMARRGRMLTAQHDARIQYECELAQRMMGENPALTRGEALRAAAIAAASSVWDHRYTHGADKP